MAGTTYTLADDRATGTDADLHHPVANAAAPGERPAPLVRARLASLDAYRGLIMLLLMSGGFGIAALAERPPGDGLWTILDYDIWQRIAFHFEHPPWMSRFGWVGVSMWDLIQPAFMLMVGVAVPYSLARRVRLGQSRGRIWFHTAVRCLVLIGLGVFLRSVGYSSTRWEFVNVLAQIGLGYWVVVLLARQHAGVIAGAIGGILLAYGLLFYVTPAPEGYDFAAAGATEEGVLDGAFRGWSMNGNLAHRFDVWLLNLFPRPDGVAYVSNPGGYQTLNFVPSIATMLLGLLCGRVLREDRKNGRRLLKLATMTAVCLAAGVLLDVTCCPIVKRIWTPSWTLFSAGWTIGLLAILFLLCDVLPGRVAFLPLIVIGMNSLLMYLVGQLARGWTGEQVQTHAGRMLRAVTPGGWEPATWVAAITPFLVVAAFWLLAAVLYRKRIFVRI